MASSLTTGKRSKEEYRRQKDLEAARKAGTAPAELDEEGRAINPHIPQYIAKAPWYLDQGFATLKHQRAPLKAEDEPSANDQWYARGQRAGPAATKYRKGACENCGAKTHKTRDCVDRPRKLGAKWSGKDIQADEVITDIDPKAWDFKRDRWNGYDSKEHDKVIEEYEKIEEARRELKAAELDKEGPASVEEAKKIIEGGAAEFSSDEEDVDEDKYAEQVDMPGQKVNVKTRTTIRNLRIREDTAKYLLNLDIGSAYYDPKTRSMRENPVVDSNYEDAHYAGDNFVRYTGDAPEMAKLQLFAWQAEERGNNQVHLQANPTQAALMHDEFQNKKEKVKGSNRQSILEKYGGIEHLDAPPKELLLAQTENYVEYSRTGRVIKGQEKAKAKSKYEEDVFLNNHKSVWGSYWDNGRWGYACCHQLLKNAYCTGQAGIDAAKASSAQRLLAIGDAPMSLDTSEEVTKSLLEQHIEGMKGKKAKDSDKDKAESSTLTKRKIIGEGDIEIDQKKLRKELKKLEERDKNWNPEMELDERKRKYNSAYSNSGKDASGVTEEELEAYRLKRNNWDDPMRDYVGEDKE